LEFVENSDDYYLEGSLVVFTKSFLIKRGFCCNNNCRNCPYKNKNAVEQFKDKVDYDENDTSFS
jgi:hypothetical protein